MPEIPDRPFTILIAALGGQGGGGVEPLGSPGGRLLMSWLVDAARSAGFPVQSTLAPGTTQRTGATTYYIEVYPVPASDLDGRWPVFRLTPRPGDVDLVIALELVEAGFAVANGYVTPDRTTLIASTHRIYAIGEKAAMTDGRFDSDVVSGALRSAAKRTVLFDFSKPTQETGGAISAVMLGAVAARSLLPFSKAAIERAVGNDLDDPETQLRAFQAGLALAADGDAAPSGPSSRPTRDEDRRFDEMFARVAADFPADAQAVLREGVRRLVDYQDTAYARRYLDRLSDIVKLDEGPSGTVHELTIETGRYLALWMSYEDVIRVAQLKTQGSRMERVRAEIGASTGQPIVVTEFLKPGLHELCALLPSVAARPLINMARRVGMEQRLSVGLHIRSTSIWGFLLLRGMAALRPIRRFGHLYREEDAMIERWLASVRQAAESDRQVGVEVAKCGRLIKGYSDTRRRGIENFLRILETVVQPGLAQGRDARSLAQSIGSARQAALQDPDGKSLAVVLASFADGEEKLRTKAAE